MCVWLLQLRYILTCFKLCGVLYAQMMAMLSPEHVGSLEIVVYAVRAYVG
jgi:hypothetical protein